MCQTQLSDLLLALPVVQLKKSTVINNLTIKHIQEEYVPHILWKRSDGPDKFLTLHEP